MKIINLPLTIPNILSLFRLFSFPFIGILIYEGLESWFVFFICAHFVTDILDGWIARRFNQMTEIGATLDSMADTGTYILAIAGVVAFKPTDFEPYYLSLFTYLGGVLLVDVLPYFKFGKFNSYHTYSAKIGAYLKGIFFVLLFTIGFMPWFYYGVIILGFLTLLEGIAITILLKEPKADVKGLFWILNEKRGL